MADQPDAAIFISDGRVTGGMSLDELGRELSQRGLPQQGLWTITIGEDAVLPQLDIVDLRIPTEMPIGEQQTLTVQLQHRALQGDDLTIELVRRNSDGSTEVVARQVQPLVDGITPNRNASSTTGTQQMSLRLPVLLAEAGRHQLEVQVQAGGLSSQQRSCQCARAASTSAYAGPPTAL